MKKKRQNKGASAANSYWLKRIQEQEQKALSRTEKETAEELARIYRQTLVQVRNDILKVYSKVEADKEAGRELLINDFYRNNRYWELFETINKRLAALGQKQIKITEPKLLDLYKETHSIIGDEIPDDKVNPQFLYAPAVDAKQALFQSWCLDGKKFSDRVWEDKTKMLELLKRELNTCVIQGKSPWESANRIAEKLGVSERNAYRLMRTELAHAQNYAATEKYKQLGFTKGKWNASNCACSHCKEQDGTIHPLTELANQIPAHPNCRCTYSVVVD